MQASGHLFLEVGVMRKWIEAFLFTINEHPPSEKVPDHALDPSRQSDRYSLEGLNGIYGEEPRKEEMDLTAIASRSAFFRQRRPVRRVWTRGLPSSVVRDLLVRHSSV
jgi:hypothetical protein